MNAVADRRVVFWDFDGVIKDSVAVKTMGYVRLFERYGPGLAERIREHHEANGGISRFDKIPLYLRWAGQSASPEQVRHHCERFSELVLQAVIDSAWVPGVQEYLRGHCARQYFVLLTATPAEEIRQILAVLDLRNCFREVFGAPTPKATAVRDVLTRLPCAAHEALVVGDSASDLQAAEANGVPFLLRCTGINGDLQRRHPGAKFESLMP
jgi:phosphoglycolate phosphatase-like HAD superfamily hydrolase